MPTDLHRRMAERVRRLAVDRGWSQNQLADFAGVDRGHLSEMLNGHYSPRLDTLERIADALGVRVVELLD